MTSWFHGAAALAALAVISCGPAQQADRQPSLVACKLLSKVDTAQAMAVDVTAVAEPTAISPGTDSCVFATRPDAEIDASSEILVQVLRHGDSATARDVFKRMERIAEGRPVAGVGQGAYLSTDPCTEVTVLQGSSVVEIHLFSGTFARCSGTEAAALTMLGRKAAARI